MEVEETRKVESQRIRAEDARLLLDKDLINQRWARFFQFFINAKAEKPNPNITSKLQQQTAEAKLRVGPTEGEIALALRAMENSKAVGTDGLPTELLKRGLSHHLITITWCEGKVPQRRKDAITMGMWKLPRDFYSASRGQSASQCDRQETGRVLREKGTTAGRTERFSPAPIDHRHDVCGSPTAGTRSEGKGNALSLLHRHPKGL